LETGVDALRAILLAAIIGFLFGALMAASRWVEEASLPVLILIQVTPWVAYSASVVQWLHGGQRPVVFVATLVCIPAFAFASMTGLRSADPAALELLRSVDASSWEMLWRVRLPTALPSLFTAARFAVGLSLAAVFYTEGRALSTRGLGAIFQRALAAVQMDAVWATAFCAAFLGAIGLLTISLLERWLLSWHASQRTAAR
jgi:NitT/TauT family transport system permease protein